MHPENLSAMGINMKTMTICTSNVGKKKEFQKFFSTQSLVSIDFPFEEIEVQETGDTFAQNALDLGAKFVIADDISFCTNENIFYVSLKKIGIT